MGCIFSKKQEPQSNYIRVLHLNGHVEEFYYPLTAGEVTGKPPKQFLCTQSQLMSGYLKPLKPDTRLEPSHIYFMLPFSTIESESSPIDIAIMAKRLVKLTKTSRPNSRSSTNSASPLGGGKGSYSLEKSPSLSTLVEFGKMESSKRSASWKPVLDTIRESSFPRKSESDLREIQSQILI